jgi:hypothetical protein
MHGTTTRLRLAAAALAASALFAAGADAATAAPRDFRFDVTGGALSLSGLPIAVPAGGAVAGTVGDDGTISVPANGVTFAPIPLAGFTAALQPTAPGTGTFDDATGATLLQLPLRIAVSGAGVPAGCGIGTAAAPIRLALRTAGSFTTPAGTTAGSPLNWATGAITLVDTAPALPASDDCAGNFNSFLASTWALGLAGKLTIPAKAAPQDGGTQTPAGGGAAPAGPAGPAPAAKTPTATAAPSQTRKLSKLVLSGPARQRGLKHGGTALTIELDQAASVTVSASVTLPGAKKRTKLAAIRRSLKTGRTSVAVTFPTALRRKAQRALRARKSVVVSVTVTATDASGARLTRSRRIRLTR